MSIPQYASRTLWYWYFIVVLKPIRWHFYLHLENCTQENAKNELLFAHNLRINRIKLNWWFHLLRNTLNLHKYVYNIHTPLIMLSFTLEYVRYIEVFVCYTLFQFSSVIDGIKFNLAENFILRDNNRNFFQHTPKYTYEWSSSTL